jgi:diguanylate cyclase (GGDEF)-like protein
VYPPIVLPIHDAMTSFFADADSTLRRSPDWLLFVACLALVAAIAIFKATVGHDVPFADFLLVPVAGMAWLARSRWYAYAVAVMAATATVVIAEVGEASAPWGAAISAGFVRLLLYILVIVVVDAVHEMQAQRDAEARQDYQTGAANSRAFEAAAETEIARLRRYGRPVSLLYLDIDEFKTINDRFGHTAGDKVLGTVSHVMRCTVRANDLVARLGGDEFAVLMPETEHFSAVAVARRLREELHRVTLPDGRQAHFSIGVASFTQAPASVDAMIHEADVLMYRAKSAGKDRIESTAVGAAV